MNQKGISMEQELRYIKLESTEYKEELMHNEVVETKQTEIFRKEFGYFGVVILLYAILEAFCNYKSFTGILYPIFIAGTIAGIRLLLKKLNMEVKKGTIFFEIAMMLLAIATCSTDDFRIAFFNRMGVILLIITNLLNQFFHTKEWGMGKYFSGIFSSFLGICFNLPEPFKNGSKYMKNKDDKKAKNITAIAVGLLIGIPLLMIVLALLGSADVLFKQFTDGVFEVINVGNSFRVCIRTFIIFMTVYCMIAYLCKKSIREEVEERKNGEPLIAITITGMLTVCYLLFSMIQILGLFLGQMQLPEGYTYAEYAREGFFQLLAVGILNLIIVLICMTFFKRSVVLKAILTVMSVCTLIMNVSCAMRMILYIDSYDLTFLRILVLWSLAVLTLIFLGVIVSVFRSHFGLFRYSMVVVTVLYIGLAFSHPDYIIASYNIYAVESGKTEKLDEKYMANLCADAAPALVPYLEKNGYKKEVLLEIVTGKTEPDFVTEFGYKWGRTVWYGRLGEKENFRTFNFSRYQMKKLLQ